MPAIGFAKVFKARWVSASWRILRIVKQAPAKLVKSGVNAAKAISRDARVIKSQI